MESSQVGQNLMALNAAAVSTKMWGFCFENCQVLIVSGSLYTLTLGLKSELPPVGAGLHMKDALSQ